MHRKTSFSIIFLAAAAALITVLYLERDSIIRLLTPFFMALVIAYLINPAVKLFEKRLSRSLSILLVYTLFLTLITAVGFFIVPVLMDSLTEFVSKLPGILDELQNTLEGIVSIIEYSGWSGEMKKAVYNEIQSALSIAQGYLSSMLENTIEGMIGTVGLLFQFSVAAVVAFYLLKDIEFFKTAALKLIPRKWRKGFIDAAKDVNHVISKFIQGQLLVAAIDGFLEIIGLYIIGVEYAFFLGVIGGVANLIPYFGPFIGAIPAVIVAFLDSPVKAVWASLVFIIVQQVENNLISPRIMQDRLGLHPVTTILVVLAGGELFGLAGLLLAVPVTAVCKVIIKHVVDAIV